MGALDQPWNIDQPIDSLASTPSEKSDERLSLDAKVSHLFETWRRPSYNYAINLGASEAVAEEAVQESFLRLIGELGLGNQIGNMPAWLFRAVRNFVVDRWRAEAREVSLDNHDIQQCRERGIDPRPTPEQAVLDRERLRCFHESFERLTAHQQEALFLRAEGFRYWQIAEIMGIAGSTVADVLRRAVTRLTKEVALSWENNRREE